MEWSIFNIPFVFRSHHLHPIFVHFPIALLFFSVLAFLYARAKRSDGARMVAVANLISGTLLSYFAVASGLFAEEALEITGKLHELAEIHEWLGFGVSGWFTILTLWAWISYKKKNPVIPLFLIFLLLGLALLGFQGYLGAYLVYEGGIGFVGSQ